MQANFTLKLNHMLRKSIISCAMIGLAVLAIASSGGGDKKNATTDKSSLFSLKNKPGFVLKAGPSSQQTNSLSINSSRYNFVMQNAVVTYRKGNTFYILPTASKMVKPNLRSNLNLINVKVQLHK